MVQVAPTPVAFRVAVDSYDLASPPLELDAHGLVLVGEAHGLHASRTPAVLHALAQAINAATLAFEWSHEELEPALGTFRRTGRFDFDELWALPPEAEVFAGDGRFTAGHFALLEALRPQVIAFDRLDPTPVPPPAVRDRELAERLRAQWDGAGTLVALVGAAHAAAEPGTMASVLGVEALMLDYGGAVEMPRARRTIDVPRGAPAVVPGR